MRDGKKKKEFSYKEKGQTSRCNKKTPRSINNDVLAILKKIEIVFRTTLK